MKQIHGVRFDESSSGTINGQSFGKVSSLSARRQKAEEDKRFNFNKKNVELCQRYAELHKNLQWAKAQRAVPLITKISYDMMNCLLQYTLRNRLYSTNSAKYDFEAFMRGSNT